jgi:hypothetical protein
MPDELHRFPGTSEPTAVFVINQAWSGSDDPASVYEAVRGYWRIGAGTRSEITLVIALANGIVRGIFRPSSWVPSPNPGEEGRWGFVGAAAQEFDAFVGTTMDHIPVKRGAANPIRLYLDGLPDAADEDPQDAPPWEVEPGDFLGRGERAEIYGGGTQSGIEPSGTSAHIFLYSDPAKGLAFGYNFDGWSEDQEVFYYTGEGQVGNHSLSGRNGTLLNHGRNKQRLQLFVAEGTEAVGRAVRQRYIGEFRVDDVVPYRFAEASDTLGEDRNVVVFRLLPVGPVLKRSRERSASPFAEKDEVAALPLDQVEEDELVSEIELEFMHSASSMHISVERVQTVIRREAALVIQLRDYLGREGRTLTRHRIRPTGLATSLLTDAFETATNTLYEAKADSSRESIRMAIGQLIDYSRFLPSVRLAILLPSRPLEDLVELISHARIGLCYREKSGEFTWI